MANCALQVKIPDSSAHWPARQADELLGLMKEGTDEWEEHLEEMLAFLVTGQLLRLADVQ